MNGNRKCFYEYRNSKRKTGENVGLLLNGAGDLVTKEKEKAKVLNAALSHPSILSPVNSAFRDARLLSEGWEQGRLTLAREGSG